MKIATFGAGCFWGVEAAFSKTAGVTATAVGFMGGTKDNPTYRQVCGGGTGHAEVVQMEYDEKGVKYEELLEVFWGIHDPTTLDRQGPDVGSQYRSVIFYHDETQRKKAEESLKGRQKSLEGKIVTKIEPAGTFWRAEEYHQKYFEKTGKSLCRI